MVELSQAALCGALGAMWLDLKGAELPDVGHRLHSFACVLIFGVCCFSEYNVTVLNCHDFSQYFLRPFYAYALCATIDN